MKKESDILQVILAIALIILLSAIVVLLFLKEVTETNKTLLIVIVTTLLAKLGTIYDYRFGSSKGSAEKEELLRKKDE